MLRRRRPFVCRQAVALVTSYLDDALSARDRARVEAHLDACADCREHLAQIRVTMAATGRIEPEDLAPEALDELVALYRRWRAG